MGFGHAEQELDMTFFATFLDLGPVDPIAISPPI